MPVAQVTLSAVCPSGLVVEGVVAHSEHGLALVKLLIGFWQPDTFMLWVYEHHPESVSKAQELVERCFGHVF